MQTDSIVSRSDTRRRKPGLASLLTALLVIVTFGACAKPQAVVHDDLLEPLATRRPWLPSASDLAAARLARAALIARPDPAKAEPAVGPDVESALIELLESDPPEDLRHLVPLAIDLRNSTLDDPIAYRQAARSLDKRWDIDPRLQGRLDRTIREDPLRLAGRRQFDGWHRLWARTFNAVVEPIGNSAITGFVLAPYTLANSLIHYFAEFSNSEPLSGTDRQALALRQEFVARHPDTEDTPVVEKKIARDLVKLDRTLALRRLRASDNALEASSPGLALQHAEAALALLDRRPEENRATRRRAERARADASERIDQLSRLRMTSLRATATPDPLAESERALAIALLREPRLENLEHPLSRYSIAAESATDPSWDGYYVETRIDFVRAIARHERGFESAARNRLTRIAATSPTRTTMARHAGHLLDDQWQNPYGAFERLKRKAARDELAFRLAGEWVERPRYPNLPVPVAYLIDAPTIAITIILAPLRAMISPWTGGTPDFQRGASLAGYRYLVRYPNGEEQRPIVDWIYDYEMRQERFGRALRMADWIPEFDSEERAELVERTATDRLARVARLDRRDERASILRGVAKEFPDSDGGRAAGLQARAERDDASPQSIRISKSFLLENPAVAGRNGIALNPMLLNDEVHDGELHAEGIVLRGGRMLEIRMVAEGGSDKTAPESRYVRVSAMRLRQLSATLDEAIQRNSLIDVDSRQAADADRDVFLERAGFGLTEDADVRPSAQSSFVYLSLRERYGMVRGRDSVLPFNLVFRGSLGDFSLGAFPRWRMPPETPDAFLYR